MKKIPSRKSLSLSTETVRQLRANDLVSVGGGGPSFMQNCGGSDSPMCTQTSQSLKGC